MSGNWIWFGRADGGESELAVRHGVMMYIHPLLSALSWDSSLSAVTFNEGIR